ncbi:MAG: hypothetical protein C5S47_03005 [Candidatus Methanogasteraceae archaeon]|uniref:Uncharacterized protein n=1 Tax=Candidatus Methanogaster sp. ANME-2c ERB4 TaxID=2759911 RepID=A0A7G9Y7D1_9EURY|nr:MAG: hypothetical protein C5S47_03005 [ANME-2 cluster archaeon]QNO43915.1 hypothetical protein NANOEKIO_00014 [Methanosarcinales archaeon ANME-2c ERB4]QNO44468.1 hypothetical protein ELEJOALA_00014 [Methanosarcinales archaeon ANME-2c ERB4]QNO44643.1 hypothetical protein GAFOMAFF_00012 [Methanosarcinales archaeon ANME-2c ERB4]QNO45200.1 hypothetical protein KDMJNAGO_00014 [Methanosarcinales archaeon ANME-2c ERB4]
MFREHISYYKVGVKVPNAKSRVIPTNMVAKVLKNQIQF